MGISDKLQVEGALETEAQKWVIAGISLRTALRPVRTKRPGKQTTAEEEDDDGEDHVDAEEACSTTPTGDESRIPARMSCPPAPRKHRICSSFSTSSSRSHHNEVKEFFTPQTWILCLYAAWRAPSKRVIVIVCLGFSSILVTRPVFV